MDLFVRMTKSEFEEAISTRSKEKTCNKGDVKFYVSQLDNNNHGHSVPGAWKAIKVK